LVDDHQLFRDGMKRILNEEPDFKCIGESGFGIQAINEVYDLKPNVVLLDVNLPDVNGDYVCKKIKKNITFDLTS
jgi:two-component system, NarL family, response regulator DegU